MLSFPPKQFPAQTGAHGHQSLFFRELSIVAPESTGGVQGGGPMVGGGPIEASLSPSAAAPMHAQKPLRSRSLSPAAGQT